MDVFFNSLRDASFAPAPRLDSRAVDLPTFDVHAVAGRASGEIIISICRPEIRRIKISRSYRSARGSMKVYISENKKEHHPSEQQQREMWLESKLVCHKSPWQSG
jgi:hypothetical protein